MGMLSATGGPLSLPYLDLYLTLDNQTVSEQFFNDTKHIERWTLRHPVKAFNRLFRVLEAENDEISLQLYRKGSTTDVEQKLSLVRASGGDGVGHYEHVLNVLGGSPIVTRRANFPWPFGTTQNGIIVPASGASCTLALGVATFALYVVLASAGAADTPLGAAVFAAAVAPFTQAVSSAMNLCAQ